MSVTIRCLLMWSIVLAFGATARAQSSARDQPIRVTVGRCEIEDAQQAERPGWLTVSGGSVEDGFSAIDNAERVHPLWTSDEADITFKQLAERAAPILIFSPNESLRRRGTGGAVPGTMPAQFGATTVPATKAFVYFRVRVVSVHRGLDRAWSDQDRIAIRDIDAPWSCQAGDTKARRIDELRYLSIRYFFYYQKDEGINGHAHDLEALEVQVKSRAFCHGQGEAMKCFYALTLASAAGSAHGAGWYTNVLQVDDTTDTVLPLSVLVERDKHATSPDRDGNGIYMPHYDTNRYTKDAWGIRDVVATGWLGGAAFRAEFSDIRGKEDRVFPRHPDPRLKVLYESSGFKSWGPNEYELLHSEAEKICQPGNDTTVKTDDDKRLAHFIRTKNFCGRSGQTRVQRQHGVTRAFASAFNDLSPGPSSRYGFMSYAQRLSLAARFDKGAGISGIVPLGREMWLFGGWLVPRVTVVGHWDAARPEAIQSFAADALYAASGSRVTDWYVATGWERRRQSPTEALRGGPSAEAGIKFRFNAEGLGRVLGFQFVGFRAGVRTSSFKGPRGQDGVEPTIRHTRLVFEIGAGSW